MPRPQADQQPGLALDQAVDRNHRAYPELQQARRCRLVVFGVEELGRRPSTPPWSRPLRRRAARNQMPIVSRALRLNTRRNANACTHTRITRSLRSRAVENCLCAPLKLAAGSARRPWLFYGKLAKARARESPARLRPAVRRASLHRWTGVLAVAA